MSESNIVETELNDKKPVEVKDAVYEVILKEIEDSYEEVLSLIDESYERSSFNTRLFEKPFKRWLAKKFDLKLSKFI